MSRACGSPRIARGAQTARPCSSGGASTTWKRRPPPSDVPGVLFGYVPVIDMTAEDILRRNPRFLTRAKSFATFLSVGPWIGDPRRGTRLACPAGDHGQKR